MIFLSLLLLVVGFTACEDSPILSVPVDKTALISLLADFKSIPQTLDQATVVTAYSLVAENEAATQKDVNEAVAGLKELKETIYATPMSFIDGGLEPHVRKALGIKDDIKITIGDCIALESLDCTYDKNLGPKIRVVYDFRYFPNLKSLDLTGNNVEELGGFAYLSKLETLSLADNPAKSSDLSSEDTDDVRSLDILGKLPLKTLDLSGKSVIVSFSSLPIMQKLESLDISENTLDSLSAVGSKCPNLKTLIATDCKISTLDDVAFCANLTSLDLSRTPVNNFTFLSSLQNLSVLTLDGVAVSDFAALTVIPNLTSLSLSGCEVSDLSWISGFSALEHLDLSENKISDSMLTLGKTGVKKLNLSGNSISSFVLNDSWSAVEELDLSENGLTAFSVSLTQGDCAIKILDLSSNALSEFSPEKVGTLESLNLSANQFKTLSLTSNSLRSLSLSANPLEGLSLNLPSLASLELACETNFTQQVSLQLPALKLLDISKQFTSVNSFLGSLTELETLTVCLTDATAPSLGALKNLKTLTVHSATDEMLSVVSQLPALESLTVMNGLVVAPKISGNQTLKSLSFQSCTNLADLSGITDLKSLESFSAVGGNLSAPVLKGFPVLKTVTFSKCNLSSLSNLSEIPLLSTLILTENGLQTIEVLGFSHLQYLDLSDNAIESLKALALDMTKGTLDLSGNKEALYEDLSSFPDSLKILVD